ncbi:MAG: hypothetical protein V1704_02605 [Candidatus Vogelbacteria bacterium]
MIIEDRLEHGVQFRAVPKSAGKVPPHWITEGDKQVMIIPPDPPDLVWKIFALPGKDFDGGALSAIGGDAENRAFALAAKFWKQSQGVRG